MGEPNPVYDINIFKSMNQMIETPPLTGYTPIDLDNINLNNREQPKVELYKNNERDEDGKDRKSKRFNKKIIFLLKHIIIVLILILIPMYLLSFSY